MHGPPVATTRHAVHEAPDLNTPLFSPSHRTAFFVVTALFFLWALPNNLNDVLIRQFMKAFQLSRLQGGLVQSAFYFGYFCISMPAAYVLRRWGYRVGLVTGVLLYGVGCLLFWPAALANQYSFFLIALFVIAAGLAFLETGGASFITLLGDPSTSERRLNFAQAFNPPGTIAGALIGTVFIFSGIEPSATETAQMKAAGTYAAFLHRETLRVTTPYLVLALVVFLFAILLMRVKFPARTLSQDQFPFEERGTTASLIHVPHFVWAVISQFFYVGAQVASWSFLIQYAHDYAHQPEKIAGYFLSGSLAIFSVGRFAATALMKYVRPNVLMGIFALINVALLVLVILFPGWVGLWALMFTSFFMSLMYPTNFALGLKGLGANTTLGASVLVMAIIGGAVATPVVGWVAEQTGSMAMSFIVPLLCYLVVAYFAFIGSKVRTQVS
ncbi:L-fucose:H+ symporter permease [Terriglobus roseus DSM 18391]|uniref:L-fucose:H+ symporter permease n=1 Tax=Terriglobus roseus (strain DSM 18391 / NRRL B-41598 / KBS 63) TaxID=926566 RepID=I3ZFS0_TERRK|nr:L-fucose:H+ symporter permease [Terriglobus roseus]AFL88088.1 L-fucose:H+ symporter permease [Terriglobus roseus DSM 18391]